MRRLALFLALLLTSVVLVSCGGEDTASTPSGDTHNDADVEFATAMIPHHAQALHMVEMAEGRGQSPEFRRLLADIEAAQGPEIEQMQGWLETWGEEVPPTSAAGGPGPGVPGAPGNHGDPGGHGAHGGGPMMPGMMGPRDLDELDRTPGEAFERMWMQMMIEHHEGAIEMAEAEMRDGESPEAIALAEDIAESQQAEIELMEELLGR